MLRCHSYFSFLEGLESPTSLAKSAARLGIQSLGLADRNFLSGAIEFFDACMANGVKPILGLELSIEPPANLAGIGITNPTELVLLAENFEGWSNLCRLSSSILSKPGEDNPTVSFDKLALFHKGLICLSGGRTGLIAQLLQRNDSKSAQTWLDILHLTFKGQLYAEIQFHDSTDLAWVQALENLSKTMRIPLVGTHIINYINPGQASLQRIVSAIRSLHPVELFHDETISPPNASLPSISQFNNRFNQFPTALHALSEISERCNLSLPLGYTQFPQIDLPPGKTALQTLRYKAELGAIQRYAISGELPDEVRSRLNHELEIIGNFGYETIFLIVEDILNHARRIGAPFSSRGSAASSLVAHCLGITSPDPIKLNLYFERFLNPARIKPPDIDTDICSQRRDEIIEYVYKRFGQERVAMVSTINRFRRRSALREVSKAFGISNTEISKIIDHLPQQWWQPSEDSEDEIKDDPYAELRPEYPEIRYQQIFDHATALIGKPHHLSIHPGGVVIAPNYLEDMAPTQMAAKGIRILQFDIPSIERLGLVKIDLLGIRGLSVLGDVAAYIAPNHPGLSIYEGIPEFDPQTSEYVSHGRTIGCFQIESPGMRMTLKEIQADSLDDIMIALALYRPGPLTGGLKDTFVRRHRGMEKIVHIHPALAPILGDTYGVILYQEQVLRIANELAGLSLADSELLRRAMSHFDPGKQMVSLRERFLEGAWQMNQVPQSVGAGIWELMAAFAGYGFPKAHAASYAQIAWWAAWAKAHHPATFMAAVLANWGGYYSQRIYLTEARRMGLKLRPPEVNFAQKQFSIRWQDNQALLYVGLDQVRNLTRRTQQRILELRPFQSLEDFLTRVDPRPLEAEALGKCGALAGFGSLSKVMRRISKGGWHGGQMSLFEYFVEDELEWPLIQQVIAQEEILGVSISAHRLELCKDLIQTQRAISTLEALAKIGQHVSIAGMRQTWRRTHTSRGEAVYFLSLEDLDGMIDVIITADVYKQYRSELSESNGPFLVDGTVVYQKDRGESVLRASQILRLNIG
jgi:DNA-directed DNA polymerase III PolC